MLHLQKIKVYHLGLFVLWYLVLKFYHDLNHDLGQVFFVLLLLFFVNYLNSYSYAVRFKRRFLFETCFNASKAAYTLDALFLVPSTFDEIFKIPAADTTLLTAPPAITP